MRVVIALFVVVGMVEAALLMVSGWWFGPLATFGVTVLTGVVGGALARREGVGVLAALQADLARGMPPSDRLAEGALVFTGAILLLTPGFLTDLAGFAFVLPVTRRLLAPRVVRAAASRVTFNTLHVDTSFGAPFNVRPGGMPPYDRPPRAPDDRSSFDHPVR